MSEHAGERVKSDWPCRCESCQLLRSKPAPLGINFEPPPMSNGKTWADYAWWQGKAEHDPPNPPTTFAEAEALTWARCWAFIDEMGVPAEVCGVIWPIAYAALNACATAWPEAIGDDVLGDSEGGSAKGPNVKASQGSPDAMQWSPNPDLSSQFGGAWPFGCCTAVVGQAVCGWPRNEDGTCIYGHTTKPDWVPFGKEGDRG